MKNIILITFLLIITYPSIAQNIFTKLYPSVENTKASRVKEDMQGNYIISGFKKLDEINMYKPFVYKINNHGDLIDSVIFDLNIPYDLYIQDVLPDTDNYVFIGFSGDLDNNGPGQDDKSMFYIKTDTNLNIIDTFFYHVFDGIGVGYSTSKKDYYGNIIVTGYGMLNGQYKSFIYKLSADGDSLASSFVPLDSSRLFINTMIDSNSYFSFAFILSGFKSRLLYNYDTNLVLIDKTNISKITEQFYSPVWSDKNTYYTSGYNYGFYRKFSIIKSTLQGELLNDKQFGIVDSNNVPALYDGLCMQDNSLFFFGNVYKNFTLPPYGNDYPSYLYISKLDTALNLKWYKLIGGDAYYTAMNIIATSDGGLLMLATRNDIYDNLNQLDVQLIKMDTTGSITWIQNIKQSNIELSLYPNPTTTQLNITLKSPHKSIYQLQIIDLQGKQIFQKQINAKQTKLDVSNLSKGIYILEGSTNSGERFSRKFVKE